MSYTMYMMTSYFTMQPWLIVLFVLWTIPWKGVALWKAARKNDVAWFVVLLIVNTVGILEILYIYLFSRWTSKKRK
ncbi:MAG: DUF5652 family protein [Candidatus Komeilibacteria bacterium]